MALDTKPEIQALQDDVLRRMSGPERLRLAMDMSDATRALAFARLRTEHPNASTDGLVREFLRVILPLDLIPAPLR